jgi:mono/diheme cytochrome c family protein
MFDNSKYRPHEVSEFFSDQSVSRPPVLHTVARGQLDDDDQFYRGLSGTNLVETFPYAIGGEVLARGQQRYDIYCSVCHGRTGEGTGMIVQRGFPQPPSFHIPRLREAPVGHFFNVITRGYGVMYPYGSRVEVSDRWAIVAYIRALQLSQNARISDLPPNDRAKLEGQP